MLQLELFTWYQDTMNVANAALIEESKDAELVHAGEVRRQLRELVKSGWSLCMSQEESPADKAGIDFIWQHPRRGWFALDAKAVDSTKCCLIRLVTVSNSTEAGEFRKLPFEDKLRFLEQLVELASGPAPELDFQTCAPPSLEQTRNPRIMLEELRRFRDRLAVAGKLAGCRQCHAWQDAIGKAMGFVAGRERQRNNPEQVAAVQARVAGIIRAYVNSLLVAKAPRNFGGPLEFRFRRSNKLSYTVHGDELKVPVDTVNVVTIGGIAVYARKAFQKRYQEVVGKHGAAEWLVLRRRTFEAQGAERAINHLLDVLERDPISS